MWLLVLFVSFILVFAGARFTGGLEYIIRPAGLSFGLDGLLIFITCYLFLLLIAIVISWLAAIVIMSLTNEKVDERIRIGVEARVHLSWAWGLLVGGFFLAIFIAFVSLYFGISAKLWWEALLVFLPHILALVTLFGVSLAKSSHA